MMKLRKSRLTLAVGAVLGAAALMPTASFGYTVLADTGVLSSASGGDTLLFPIYTTVTPATTSFSVTNTGDVTIAAKIRFREQDKSMDVLDFIVVFSPYDKFDFSVSQGPDDARPIMKWGTSDDNKDESCLIGPGTGFSVPFPGPSAFVDDEKSMSVGHLEVIGMAQLDATTCVSSSGAYLDCADAKSINLAEAAKHGTNGKPANCGILKTVFSSPANVATLNTASVLLDVPNVLVGRYVITGAGLGIEAGGDAIAIANSQLSAPTVPASAQSPANCLAANCTSTYAWDKAEWDHPHLAEMGTLDMYQEALTAGNVSGDWSNNPANEVGVDWVLSFPNKYAYLDLVKPTDTDPTCGGTAAVTSPTWCLLNATRTTNGTAGVWTGADTTDLCISPANISAWDRDELMNSGNVTVSPGTLDQLKLCRELEVFTVAPKDAVVRDSVIQTNEGAYQRRKIYFDNLDVIRGWAQLTIPWAVTDGTGDSISGVVFTTRNTDDPTINNGSLTELQKNVGGVL